MAKVRIIKRSGEVIEKGHMFFWKKVLASFKDGEPLKIMITILVVIFSFGGTVDIVEGS